MTTPNRILLVLIVGLACIVPFYAMELYLYASGLRNVERAAERYGLANDPRTTAEVIRDLGADGMDARPFFRLLDAYHEVMPLGAIPSRAIVPCNELGQYLVYRSDRQGFNNPDAIWDAGQTDVMILGDSMSGGICHPDNRGFAERIRVQHPALVNLAVGGNGPLEMLAILKEYIPTFQTKLIFWINYAGNYYKDLMVMRHHAHLLRYLREDHSQQGRAGRPPQRRGSRGRGSRPDRHHGRTALAK